MNDEIESISFVLDDDDDDGYVHHLYVKRKLIDSRYLEDICLLWNTQNNFNIPFFY